MENIVEEIRDLVQKKQKELKLSFFEDTHRYKMLDIDGKVKSNFPSVSKVMKLFYREFPTDEAAEKKSKGDPELKMKLIKEWAEAGVYSTNMGSRVHYILENESVKKFKLNKEVRQPIFECDSSQINKGDRMVEAGIKFLDLMKERGAHLIDTEMVLGHPELGYTGQPDKVWLIKNKSGLGYGLLITDYKTNKPKNFEETKFTDRMYSPFESLPNTSLGHYYTQLPFYGKLLIKMLEGTKYENIKLLGSIIVLLKEDGEFQEYRVPKEVMDTIMGMDMKKYLN
jgi:hypothetical protein